MLNSWSEVKFGQYIGRAISKKIAFGIASASVSDCITSLEIIIFCFLWKMSSLISIIDACIILWKYKDSDLSCSKIYGLLWAKSKYVTSKSQVNSSSLLDCPSEGNLWLVGIRFVRFDTERLSFVSVSEVRKILFNYFAVSSRSWCCFGSLLLRVESLTLY
jgi:hypothetical protein